ncbi:MAG: hypothetical protein WAL04_16845 [Acidimicrobiales bacterium]|jgi:hypothetical protein
MEVEGDSLVVRLTGWRMIWALQRGLRVPLSSVVAVTHDPAAYQHVSRRLRQARRARTTLFKVGAQHGRDGWSFWACGFARNAVLVETTGVRYRFLVVEVADPDAVAETVRSAAGLVAVAPSSPPKVGSITDASSLGRQPKGSTRAVVKMPSEHDEAHKDAQGPSGEEIRHS